MRRFWGLALLAGVGALAASAYASGDSVRFRATVIGTFAEEWTYTEPAVADGICTLEERGSGVRRITFRGSQIVEVGHERVRPFVVRVRGKRERGGSVTTERKCPGDEGFAQIADCVVTGGPYSQGSLRITSPAPRQLSLGTLRLPADPGAALNCPRPSGLRAPALGPAKLPAKDLVMLKSMSVRKRFDRPLQQPQREVVFRVRWTVTFTRVSP